MAESKELEQVEKLLKETWDQIEETSRKIRGITSLLGGPAITPLSEKSVEETAIVLTHEMIEQFRALPTLRDKEAKLLEEYAYLSMLANKLRKS